MSYAAHDSLACSEDNFSFFYCDCGQFVGHRGKCYPDERGERMSTTVLKNGVYRFTLGEWGQTKDVTYKKGFSDATAACFKQDWRAVGINPEDCEIFESDGIPVISVYGLIDPATGEGIEKGGGKIGFDMPRAWSDFMAMFKASGADPTQMGKPVYPDGTQAGTIDIEVKALPGSGNFAPKNVLVSWRNVERTEQATKLFTNAFAKKDSPKQEASKVDVTKAMGKEKVKKE